MKKNIRIIRELKCKAKTVVAQAQERAATKF
jgi:hypothetical protein